LKLKFNDSIYRCRLSGLSIEFMTRLALRGRRQKDGTNEEGKKKNTSFPDFIAGRF
jgi:hypothetical protein